MKRKQLLPMLLVLLLPVTGWCQLEKGSYLGSASAGISFQSSRYPSSDVSIKNGSINIYLDNSFGIFVANRLAIGPGLNINGGYAYYNTGDDLVGEVKTSATSYTISFEPFIRYYFYHHEKLAFFGNFTGSIGYGQDFEKYKSGNSEEQKGTYNNLRFGGSLAVGFVYFINRNIGIETSLGYLLSSFETKNEDNYQRINYGQLGITAGLSFYLGKCKKKEKEKETSSPQ